MKIRRLGGCEDLISDWEEFVFFCLCFVFVWTPLRVRACVLVAGQGRDGDVLSERSTRSTTVVSRRTTDADLERSSRQRPTTAAELDIIGHQHLPCSPTSVQTNRRVYVGCVSWEDSSVCTGLFVRGAFENVCLKGALWMDLLTYLLTYLLTCIAYALLVWFIAMKYQSALMAHQLAFSTCSI